MREQKRHIQRGIDLAIRTHRILQILRNAILEPLDHRIEHLEFRRLPWIELWVLVLGPEPAVERLDLA